MKCKRNKLKYLYAQQQMEEYFHKLTFFVSKWIYSKFSGIEKLTDDEFVAPCVVSKFCVG